MEALHPDAPEHAAPRVVTYAQYIAKGLRIVGERELPSRDLAVAWEHAPVDTCCVEFFERAEAIVGGELLRGEPRNRSIGYGPDDRQLIDDELRIATE